MTVTLLAPAYDEEAVIEDFVRKVVPTLTQGSELLIVDDGSVDATPTILDRLAREHPLLRVVRHPVNRGLGAALATGFATARGDVVVTLDADLSHPLELVETLVAGTVDADAVFASRFMPGGGMVGVPRWRRVISALGNLVFRRLFRTNVRDLTTGMRAYRRDVVSALELRATGFDCQLEIAVRLLASGATITEVPLVLTNRAAGTSKMRYLRLVPAYGRTVASALRLRWRR